MNTNSSTQQTAEPLCQVCRWLRGGPDDTQTAVFPTPLEKTPVHNVHYHALAEVKPAQLETLATYEGSLCSTSRAATRSGKAEGQIATSA